MTPTALESAPTEFEVKNERAARVTAEVRRLWERHDAQKQFEEERAAREDIPPFDAGLLSEVLARPQDPPHRVENLIPFEAGTLLVAQRKTGKTTLELNIARALITGEDLLGKFGTRPIDGNVALLNYEVSAQTLARWADEHGLPHHRLFLVNLRGRRNPLSNPYDRASLATKLRELDVESLIVDPFGRAFTGASQNDPGEVGGWLADLDRFARGDAGAKDVILAAHAGWNGERSRGSTALEDWADSIITVARDTDRKDLRFIRAEGRDIDLPEDQLVFDPDTRTLSLAGAGSRKTANIVRKLDALKPIVLSLLAEAPSMSGNQIDQGIAALKKTGDIDLAHSKGDGAKTANLLEAAGLLDGKDTPRGRRYSNAIHATSPTTLEPPQGNPADFPYLPYREGRSAGNTTDPNHAQGSHTHDTAPED